ncbi:electron transfer flavoprotein subunit alpha/FixB family protein [Dasania marina]|uniref:electron transfer flavoprotein subunit alpha/FixB family protein n=1 Tax=Dasania marina TaxID=471499 RepID=UPI0003602253|nr:FAD-binding protein [Dasania marina]
MAILIIAEHNSHVLNDATLQAINAASQIDTELHLLVAGKNCRDIANTASKIPALHSVLLADNPAYEHQLAENMAALISALAVSYSHIMAAATSDSKNVMPRVAALLDVAQISDIIQIDSPSIFLRPIYAGNAIATIESLDPIKVITVRATNFEATVATGGDAKLVELAEVYDMGISRYISEDLTVSERPDLTAAKTVISGGRGIGSAENFAILDGVATKLDAAIGASRAAVDAGFASNDQQVGQTGKIVAPELYIAVGISGAIQHLAGMKDSKVIVAINKDPEAPIFQIADYGLAADLFQAIPELEQAL